MSKFYVTTPIYYVNANPHIGHAYTSVICDCLARYRRIKGDRVYYLTGTDEHGEKVKKAALNEGEDIQKFVDRVMENFKNLWKQLNISYDYFIRTTHQEHIDTVKRVITILYEKDDIYKAKYQGFYCMPCESFWTETQVKEAGRKCSLCGRAVEEIEEENYFFRLSRYERWLKDYLTAHSDFIQPKIRYNEVMGFLDNNTLTDLCISRPKTRVSWGIEFPRDKDYVVYVWFDALLNYISAIGYGVSEDKFNKWHPADLHLIGKDILRHHAIFWPIMLQALGLEIPKTVFAHGWWKVGEEKMSKSKGNIVNPFDVIKEIGVDAFRYFLLREISVGSDGNFSWSAVINRVNSDLANDLGNLVYRTLNMAEKYFEGDLSFSGNKIPGEFDCCLKGLDKGYDEAMETLNFSDALELVFNFIRAMNKYIEETKPWVLWKEKKVEAIKEFIYALLEGIRIVAIYIYPFMPAVSEAIQRQLGLENKRYSIKKEKPLFPRIEME